MGNPGLRNRVGRCSWCRQPLGSIVLYALDGYQNKMEQGMEQLGAYCSDECMERGIVDRYGLGALAEPEEHCWQEGIYGGRE